MHGPDGKRTVELKTAYHWHCEECGVENFALPRKAELTDDEAEEAYRLYHYLDSYSPLPDDWRQFEIVEIPDVVECDQCYAKFATKDEREGA